MDIKRDQITKVIKERLEDYPAVCVTGPRQVGKTTLAKSFKGQYFDLEKDTDWKKLDFEWDQISTSKELIILDEAQERPDLFKRLRSAIDEDRKRNGRFLLLGSVSPRLIESISQSLTGRISYVELTPFTILELGYQKWKDLWFYGGFPDGGILKKRKYYLWQKDYLENIASRDLPELGLQSRPSSILHLFKLIASAHGQNWNASLISKSMGVTYHTVNHYLDLLKQVYLIRALPPYEPSNFKKRLVKSPKIYWRDSGLFHYLRGFETQEELMSDHSAGLSFEGYVIEQILNSLNTQGVIYEAFSFRTSDQYECDLIVKRGRKLFVFEIKMSSSPKNIDQRRLEKISEWLKPTKTIIVANIKEPIENKKILIGNLEAAIAEVTA